MMDEELLYAAAEKLQTSGDEFARLVGVWLEKYAGIAGLTSDCFADMPDALAVARLVLGRDELPDT